MSVSAIVRELLPGAKTTILLTVEVFPIALAGAIVIALARVYRIPVLAQAAAAFVEIIRSLPLLLILFFMYFALPFEGIFLGSTVTGIIGLAINFAAYQAEIIRAGILSVPTGYLDAGWVLGMNRRLRLRRIITPVALRVVLPPMANSVIELFKATAVVSLVAVHEIVFIGSDVANRTFKAALVYGLISLFYIGLGYPATLLMGSLERKMRLPETFAAGLPPEA